MSILSTILFKLKSIDTRSNASILFYPKDKLSKIYVFSDETSLNYRILHEIFESFFTELSPENDSNFQPYDIKTWVNGKISYSVSNSKNGITTDILNTPERVQSLARQLSTGFFNSNDSYSLTEVKCNVKKDMPLISLLTKEKFFNSNPFRLISGSIEHLKVIEISRPLETLKKIQKDKLIMDTLVEQSLMTQNGRLKGIRHSYSKHKLDIPLICHFYNIESIDDYEREKKLVFTQAEKSSNTNSLKIEYDTLISAIDIPQSYKAVIEIIAKYHASPLNVRNILQTEEYKLEWRSGITKEMIHNFKQLKQLLNQSLSSFKGATSNNLEAKLLNKVTPVENTKPSTKEVVDNCTKKSSYLSKNTLERVRARYQKATITEEVLASKVPPPVKTTNSDKDAEVSKDNVITHKCAFKSFYEDQSIIIKIENTNSLNAFDFYFINNQLVVTINRDHVFFNSLYARASEEGKRILNMMISSLCHMSQMNTSEVTRSQDRKLFERWSEYLEEYLLKGIA